MSLAAAAGIGNQWQWRSFTLGLRWLGISVPVATLESSVKSRDAMFAVEDKERAELRRMRHMTSVTAATLLVGWSF